MKKKTAGHLMLGLVALSIGFALFGFGRLSALFLFVGVCGYVLISRSK